MNKQQRAALLIITVIALVVAALSLTDSAHAAGEGGPTVDRDTAYAPAWAWTKDWKPCANDEPQPTRCVWDALHNGDGHGHSYLQTRRGTVIYMRHLDAHLLLLPMYAA